MSFFQLSTGETPAATTSFDSSVRATAPDGTVVIGLIEDAGWFTTDDGEELIKLKWATLEPAEYLDVGVNQSLRVLDADPKTRDKAITFLCVIDNNCKGEVQAAGEAKPTSEVLASLINCQMPIQLGLFKGYNFVRAIGAPEEPDTSSASDKWG